MIEIVVIAGLAGLWPWVVLNDEEGLFRRVHARLLKRPLTKKWMKCPWCSGAWFAGVASLAAYHPWHPLAIVTALAAACVTGLIGTYMAEVD